MLPISVWSPPTKFGSKSRTWFNGLRGRWIVWGSILITFVIIWLWSPFTHTSDRVDSLQPYFWRPFEPQIPDSLPLDSNASVWERRKNEVKDAYVHALSGYLKHAFPHDELLSVSGRKSDKFNGWGVTLIDSMDTMWMMGLHAQFQDAVRLVTKMEFTIKGVGYAPFFETTIRYLGGLLSAYALSKEPILLIRADDLGKLLLPAFNGTPSGLPAYSVNTKTGRTGFGWMGSMVLFSEAASCQLEFKYLAKLTRRPEYYQRVEKAMDVLYDSNPPDGLFSSSWYPHGIPRGLHYSVGASADSGYEYLLKQWLLSGDKKARKQYLESIDGIINNLFYITAKRELLYVTDTRGGRPSHNLEHLSCFLPGILALGAHTLDLPSHVKEVHEWAAKGLAYTCWISYADQSSGLGPDVMAMEPGPKWIDQLKIWETEGRKGNIPPGLKEGGTKPRKSRDYRNSYPVYLLRPETIESLFILWKTTGDVKWRERGYTIFKALNKITKTDYGYAAISGVDGVSPSKMDDMPSYFLAETLKYLYLMFDDSDPYPLNQWVYNTEAHPLPIFTWEDWEKEVYNIH
ncbi:glycoside hydrolase family 47 protein [Collybia nuda]|uniref:alpha-1,2-Mannosidase n=1 Tax=Collybia nuda TaxID=64659 RepID=A0A9P5YCT5_9AGAR|nr:glycoside hydrolase family 47 protein [Collybia nuda]